QHFPPASDAGKGEHSPDGAACHRAHRLDQTVNIELGHKGHLAPAGERDFAREDGPRVGRETAHVLSSRFLAAGKRTLFKISLYPGDLGWSVRSVGGSPTWCCGSSGSCPPRKVHVPLP